MHVYACVFCSMSGRSNGGVELPWSLRGYHVSNVNFLCISCTIIRFTGVIIIQIVFVIVCCVFSTNGLNIHHMKRLVS